MRIACVLACGVIILPTMRTVSTTYGQVAPALLTFLPSLTLSFMTAMTGGFSSQYYIGNFMVWGAAQFLAMPKKSMVVMLAASSLAYFGINLVVHNSSSAIVSPAFFLGGFSVLMALFSGLAEDSRRSDFLLRAKLETVVGELQQLDNLKSNFFANVSHELRTPLTLSIGPTETLLQKEVDPTSRQQLLILRRNQSRLLELINNLLDFAKLEAGKTDVSFTKTDLALQIKVMVEAAEVAAKTKNIHMLTEVPDAPVFAFIDREKFERMVMNLVGNAFKFTDPGGTIHLRLSHTQHNAIVAVTDSGIGIPDDKQESIFDRFSQVDSSKTRKYSGTGIGLAMVKEYACLHGGTVTVQSRENNGSTFTLEIPLGQEHLDPEHITTSDNVPHHASRVPFDAEPQELRPPVPAPKRTLSAFTESARTRFELALRELSDRPRVLIVDDTHDMRLFLSSILEDRYEVLLAKDGREGLERAKEFLPDLILSDVMMPGMSGDELCQAVREDTSVFGTTPIVLITARKETQGKLSGLKVGADDYLYKPFDPAEVILRVNHSVTKRRQELALLAAHQQMDADLQSAADFQQTLLSEIPDLSWLNIGHIFRPLDVVSGDFYQISQLSPQKIRFLLIDVMGHGVQAAIRTAAVKAEYDRVKHLTSGPSLVLKDLESAFLTRYQDTRFAGALAWSTVGYEALCLDAEKENSGILLHLASKSVQRPIHVREGHAHELSEATATHEHQELSLKLSRGDRIFLFTDGITEQSNCQNECFGIKQLLDTLEHVHANANLQSATQEILSRFDAFRSTSPMSDDLTLLALECPR